MSTNISVNGLYPNEESILNAMETLKRSGFRPTDSAALVPENAGNKDLLHKRSNKAGLEAAAGSAVAGMIGGTIGYAIGAGMLPPSLTTHVNSLVTAGPLVSALAGIGLAGVVGWCAGALAGYSKPTYEAVRFKGRSRSAGVLLSVHCDTRSWVKLAKCVLHDTGAHSVSVSPEVKADFGTTIRTVDRVQGAPISERAEPELKSKPTEISQPGLARVGPDDRFRWPGQS